MVQCPLIADVQAWRGHLRARVAGHDAGTENWATIASLIGTYKLNAVDPLAYLTSTLTLIVNGHKQRRGIIALELR